MADNTDHHFYTENAKLKSQLLSKAQDIEELNYQIDSLNLKNQDVTLECQKYKATVEEKERYFSE